MAVRPALVVPTVASVGAAAFLAWKPGVARSMLGSPRALGFTLGVAALVIGLGWALPRLGRRPATTMLAQAVPVVLAFVVTVLPAFHDVTAQEAFPVGTAAPAGTSTPAAPSRLPTVVARSRLHGVDHRATGDVLVVRTASRLVVRLESLDVEPGPDYHVYLVHGPDRRSPEGGTYLGRLRANKGSLNYAVPAGIDAEPPVTVLVWCRAFAVPVAVATFA